MTTPEECILKSKTYSLKVYINLTIKKTNKNILLNKYVLLTEIPLITKNANFIINGNPRIMVVLYKTKLKFSKQYYLASNL